MHVNRFVIFVLSPYRNETQIWTWMCSNSVLGIFYWTASAFLFEYKMQCINTILYVIRQITYVTTSYSMCVCVWTSICVIAVHIPLVFCLIIVSLYYCIQIVLQRQHTWISLLYFIYRLSAFGDICVYLLTILFYCINANIHNNKFIRHILCIYKCKMRFVLLPCGFKLLSQSAACAIYWPTYRLLAMCSPRTRGGDGLPHSHIHTCLCIYPIRCMWAILICQLVLHR